MSRKILYVINPAANDDDAVKSWGKVRSKYPSLPETPIDITTITDFPALIEKETPELIVIAGGDGTVNFVTNAVLQLKKKPLLAVLPLGFGNALSHCLGVETTKKAMAVIEKRPSKLAIDIIKTNVANHSIGVFNISVGYDARIVHYRRNYRYIGLWSYLLSGVTSLIVHPEREITFTIDDKTTLRAMASGLVIANCPIVGANYVAHASARLNDGFLDCTLFSTKYDYLANLRIKGFKHPLYSEIGKTYFKAKKLRIEGEPFVQIDGDPEIVIKPLELEIMPSAVTFLKNTKENINQKYLPYIE